MKYMILLYAEPDKNPVPGTPEFDTMMEEFFSLDERMKDRTTVLAGEGLLGHETATTIKERAGRVETLDGPFAETREHLGGYYVIDVPDLDAALTYAALIPSAHFGTIEVRPLMDYNPAS
jgi:hypothetical protein